MNDHQLAIILRNYRRLLEMARNDIVEKLPKELAQQDEDTDDDFEEKHPVLAPLDKIIAWMDEDEEELMYDGDEA